MSFFSSQIFVDLVEPGLLSPGLSNRRLDEQRTKKKVPT